MIANGDGEAEQADKIAARWPAPLQLVAAEDSDNPDGWFSWRPCEGCGSTLGGDRYGVAVLVDVDVAVGGAS